MTQKQQVRLLTTIENKMDETHKTVSDLSQRHQQSASGIKKAIGDMSTQIVTLFSFKGYLDDWIRQIGECRLYQISQSLKNF
jgi:hypothetical protein